MKPLYRQGQELYERLFNGFSNEQVTVYPKSSGQKPFRGLVTSRTTKGAYIVSESNWYGEWFSDRLITN